MELKIDKQASKRTIDMIRKAPASLDKSIKIGLFRIGNELRNKAATLAPYRRNNEITGKARLGGTLRRSITMSPMNISQITNRVEVGSNLVYARIADQGGWIKAHTIIPKRGKFLVFTINGKRIFTKKVNKPRRYQMAYKNTQGGRGYLTPAFKTIVDGRAMQIMRQEVKMFLNSN